MDVALDVVLVRALDLGCTAPLDLGLAAAPISRVLLPSEARVGASLSPLVIAFPQDSSHFAEKAADPYI